MSHDADFRSHLAQPLDLMKQGGKGWVSVPSRAPFVDLPVVISELLFRGILHKVAVNMVPLEIEEGEPGMWEILISTYDLEDGRPDTGQGADLPHVITRSSGGQGPEKPSPPAAGEGVKAEISDSGSHVDLGSRPEGD